MTLTKMRKIVLLVPLLVFMLVFTTSAYLLYSGHEIFQTQLSPTASLQQPLLTLASPSAMPQPVIPEGTAVPSSQATLRSTPMRPISSPPLPNTEPGSILGVNETWRQDGAAIQLSEAEVYAKGILVKFRVTNLAADARSITYSANNFTAVDNLGGEVPVGSSLCGGCMMFAKNCAVQTELLSPGDSTTLRLSCEAGYQSDAFALAVNTTSNHAVVSVIVSAHDVLGISGARWRVPIK